MAQSPVAPPRIPRGAGVYFFGFGSILVGAFLSLASSEITPGMGAVGGLFLLLGFALIAGGFWRSLFSRIEERLIDIEAALKTPAGAAEFAGEPAVDNTKRLFPQ